MDLTLSDEHEALRASVRDLVEQAPRGYPVRQTERQSVRAGDRRGRPPRQPLDGRRVAQFHVRPDRVDHGPGRGEFDGRPIPRRHLLLPGVDRFPLIVAPPVQLIKPVAPPGTGRLRFTRSPARHPS